MSNSIYIDGEERRPLPEYAVETIAKGLNLSHKKAEILGLHKTGEGIAPGDFVGAVRLENGAVLRVASKFPAMNYLRMYIQCAETGRDMGKCLQFWPEQETIQSRDAAPPFSVLIVAAFLRELDELCRRQLRRHFTRHTENLTAKIKGKICVAENIRRNTTRGRAERVVCAFQHLSDDILENRLLLAALKKSEQLLPLHTNEIGENMPTLQHWTRTARAALRGVQAAAVKNADFNGARRRGAFAAYRRPLRLARVVLTQLGFHPHADIPRAPAAVVPFALNSALLFERYAECELSKQYPGLQATGDENFPGDARGFNRNIQPDFWRAQTADDAALIIDAKYKKQAAERNDIYQVLAYGRHRALRKTLGIDAAAPVKLKLAYPHFAFTGKDESDAGGESEGYTGGESDTGDKGYTGAQTDNSFLDEITLLPIKCPQWRAAATANAAA